MSRSASLAAILFILAGLIAVGHLITRRETETEHENSKPLKKDDEQRSRPFSQPGDVALHEVGDVRTSPRRREVSEESSKLPPGSNPSARGGNTRAEARAKPSSHVPDVAGDHPEQTPLIDPTFRRQLEDDGVEPSAIDALERRLRSTMLDAGDAAQAPPEAPEDSPDDDMDDPSLDEDRFPIGVTLDRIRENMPAGMAGLINGDQMLTYDGSEISSINDLREAIYNAPPDTAVIATVLRDGSVFEVWLEPGVLGAEMIPPHRRPRF
jgi:membrane-associated protease RseP (regulator of RpoE activity)